MASKPQGRILQNLRPIFKIKAKRKISSNCHVKPKQISDSFHLTNFSTRKIGNLKNTKFLRDFSVKMLGLTWCQLSSRNFTFTKVLVAGGTSFTFENCSQFGPHPCQDANQTDFCSPNLRLQGKPNCGG